MKAFIASDMFVRLAFLALFAAPLFAATIDTGKIAGAKFTIARPAHWNHRLLLLAHGHRPEPAPLVADLDPTQFAYRSLLDEGWMIDKTSYRRNGGAPTDAIADLDALRDHIEKNYGQLERVIIEGESLGGTAAILMAERNDGLYSGAIAIGANFNLQEYDQSLGFSLKPQIPLILLANQTELTGPRDYVNAKIPRTEDEPQPVVFRVSRDGRANINQRERLAALRVLNAWLDRGPTALPRPLNGGEFFDITAPATPQPSQVTFLSDGRSFDAQVVRIDLFSGNFTLNAQPEDFARVGLGKNAYFQLVAHGEAFRVFYGRDFNVSFRPIFRGKHIREPPGTKRGEWITLVDADGFFIFGRNFANAATTAHLAVGDSVT
ncbi:MAG: alpha/beta hydrolase, partial [Verrucomicrobiota bacterium]|nr:alpha/beta hydrolase [Verrucomicrobiota bacterium]